MMGDCAGLATLARSGPRGRHWSIDAGPRQAADTFWWRSAPPSLTPPLLTMGERVGIGAVAGLLNRWHEPRGSGLTISAGHRHREARRDDVVEGLGQDFEDIRAKG